MQLRNHWRAARERIRLMPAWQKRAFAFVAIAIMLAAIAANVEHERLNDHPKIVPDSHRRTIDLDYFLAGEKETGVLYHAVGPLGQIDLSPRADGALATYRFGSQWVTFSAAGSTYSGIDAWRGSVGSSAPSVEGVRASYPYFYPSTGLEIVSGIDGMEMVLEMRSPTFLAPGDLSYSFFVETSPDLSPAISDRPLWVDALAPQKVSGSIPLRDPSGRDVFRITPATALINYRESPGPVVSRVNGVDYIALFPAHQEDERAAVPLDYEVEFVGGVMKLSLIVPTKLLADPAIKWPVRIDPGITNPIADSQYFVDETILMDSDLVVTFTGAAQFSNVELVMNRTEAPNYNISISPGGRMTLLNSRVRSNGTGLPYAFWVNGSITGQDTLINDTRDGLNVTAGNATLSNVTFNKAAGPGIVLTDSNASISNSTVNGSAGIGIMAYRSVVESTGLQVLAAGADGIYFNATAGNVSWARVNDSALNGIKIVNGSRINFTYAWVNVSGHNGVLVIGGAPTIESSEVANSTWSGVVMLDDHSAYLANSTIHNNSASGVQAGLNSTADIYLNRVYNNTNYGIFVNRSNPNVEHNEVWNNSVGVFLEGAHKPNQPTAGSGTEGDYPGSRPGFPVDIQLAAQVPSSKDVSPGQNADYGLKVFNNQVGADNVFLAVISDPQGWATVNPLAIPNMPGMSSADAALTVVVPAGASICSSDTVQVQAHGTPGQPWAVVTTTTYVKGATTLTVPNQAGTQGQPVTLTARLLYNGNPVASKSIAFTLNGNSIGSATTDSQGWASKTVTATYPPASQPIGASFTTDSCYFGSSGSGTLTVSPPASHTTSLTAQSITGQYGDLVTLSALLMDTTISAPIAGRIVHFTVAGVYQGAGETDALGYARYAFKNLFNPGNIAWNASFDGSANLLASAASTTFASTLEITVIQAGDLSIKYGTKATYQATLTDDEGVAISGMTVVFTRGSTVVSGLTDGAGHVSVLDPDSAGLLPPGSPYNVVASYAGDSHYLLSSKTTNLYVTQYATFVNLTSYSVPYTDTVTIKAQLVDETGASIENKNVYFCIDGGVWQPGPPPSCAGNALIASGDHALTDSQGWATVTWTVTDRLPSTYFLNATFAGDQTNTTSYNWSNVTVLPETPVFTGPVELRTVLGGILQITVRLTDDDGTILFTKPVRATLDGATYASGTTDIIGYWTYSFDTRGMLSKRYSLVTIYDAEGGYSAAHLVTRVLVEFSADLHDNNIHDNAGWGVYANDSLTNIVGDTILRNGNNVDVRNGSLQLYNSTVGSSNSFDYRVMDGGSLFSTNTTFNRNKVDFAASGVILWVRWYFDASIMDPTTRVPLAGIQVTLKDTNGVTVFDSATRTDGILGPGAVTEYTQNLAGKTELTPHTLALPGSSASLVLHMDVSKNLTLYNGTDSDNDGIPNALESFADVKWFEGEGHFVEPSQIVPEPFTSGNASVKKLESDSRITNEASFYTIPVMPVNLGGDWRVLVRAASDNGQGRFRIRVSDALNTTLLDENFTVANAYSWYGTRTFFAPGSTVVRIGITDLSGDPIASRVRVDRFGLYREKDWSAQRTHWPGQASDPTLADEDFDFTTDGFEVRANSFWYEAEWQVAFGSPLLTERVNASGGRTLEHPSGVSTIATFDQTFVASRGDYRAIIRLWNGAGTPTAQVTVQYTCTPNPSPSLSFSRPFAIGENYTTLEVPFNYRTGTCNSFTLKVIDATDVTPFNNPKVELDRVGLIRVDRDPVTKGDVAFSGTPPVPDPKFTPVILRGPVDAQGYLFYVSTASSKLVKVPLTPISLGQVPTVTGSISIGAPSTEILSVQKDGMTRLLVGGTSGGNGVVYVVAPDGVMSLLETEPLPAGATPNGMAYKDGTVYFTTQNGWAYAYNLTATGTLVPLWSANRFSALGNSHGGAAVHNDQVYFPFDKGITVYSTDPALAPGTERWTIQAFPNPCPTAPAPSPPLPPGDPGACTGVSTTWPTGVGGVNGTPVFDMGHVYFVVEIKSGNTDRFAIFHYNEQGGFLWARELNWTGTANAGTYRVHLITKDGLIIASGRTLDAIDKITGARVWRHDFNNAIPNADVRWAPVVIDGMLLVQQGITLYAFDADGVGTGEMDAGNHFTADLSITGGAKRGEDLLWSRAFSNGETNNGQPLFGDFDNDGYFDIVVLHGSKVLYLGEILSQFRSYIPWAQYGLDATRKGEADYLRKYFALDPMDGDFDRDGILDAEEIAKFAGYTFVEAEDATYWNAWNNDESVVVEGQGGAKNFNFFHQFGATLTSGYTILDATTYDNSSITLDFFADKTGTYRFSMASSGGNTVDLVYGYGTTLTTRNANPAAGYGSGEYQYKGRPTPLVDSATNIAMQNDAAAIFQSATYARIGYRLPDGACVFVPVNLTVDSSLASVHLDANRGIGTWLIAYVSFEFTVELSGSQNYCVDIGLDLRRVDPELLGSVAFPDTVRYVRIEDVDKLRVDRQGMNPYLADGDNDNITDGEEFKMGWFPLSGDADKDGLDDYEEWFITDTNPGDRDSDHDGIRDRVELGRQKGDSTLGSIYDNSTSWGSRMEAIAHYFMGDPLYTPSTTPCNIDPAADRCIANWAPATGYTITDPLNPDTDGDGLPDGWIDGWIYDESGRNAGPVRSYQYSTVYQKDSRPIRYNESNWYRGDVFDAFPQVWEGEDLDLSGSRATTGVWSFWPSQGNVNQGYDLSRAAPTRQDFVKRGPKETSALLPDTDTDGVPDGYEAWYATRAPVIYLSEAMGTTTPDPTNPDSDTDQENSAAPSTLATRSGSGGAHTVTADTTMVLQQALGVPTSGPFKVRQVRLDLTSPLANSVATVELWYQSGLNCENAVSPAVRLAGAEVTSYLNGQGFTSFNFNTPVPVSLVGGGCLYLALRGSGSSITWRGGQATTNTWTRDYVVSSVWTQVSPTPLFSGNYEIYGEAVSSSGDGATLIQEYVAGTSPKAWNTDEWVGGRQTGVSDKLRDGDEITNGVIWRTDAQFGALEVGGYGPGTSIYYDTDPANTPISDWLFLTYEATVVDPLEPFGGSQNRTVTLFRLFDGGTIAYNVTTQKVYIIHPGSDFASPLRRTANLTVEQYYKGKAIVYTVTGGGDAAWKWNDVIRPYVTGQDPLPTPLYDQHKQLFATSPFDWDTDDDGIGDGQEQRRLFDDEEDPGFATKDSLNNGRDPDSDNDGLTDGQEMLQICSSWNELYSPGDANPPPSCSTPTLNVNPDGDTGYAMADRDSDGDGINDSKEVLWSSDSDAVPDGRINLVDPDSDGDLLCDGWCTVTMIAGMPVTANNGEDKNQNGANEQGEPSPVKYDTDGDGLWDGADVGANPGELMVLPSEGTPTTRPLGGDALAQSISSNQTNPDTDGDGVSDGAEVATYTAFYFAGTGQGTPSTRPNIKMDPTKNDTEGDGILDGVEFRRTDGSRLDTDGDAINDGLEDANKDGVRQTTEVDPLRADTDQDGLTDSKELGAAPYVHDSNEPDPLKADTDGDGVSDGNECFITDAGCTGSGLTRDSDNPTDGIPDILEKDSDGDGLDDGAENANKDGTIDANTELNPTLADTDSDGLWDGAEPVPFTDTSDADANINGRDIDSNANGANDQTDTFVILRTNALAGAYGTTGAWVAVDTTVNLLGADGNPDLSDANARYDWSATLTQLPTGTGTVFIYFGSGATDGPMALKTAQGYAVYFNAGTPNKVYIVKDETTTWEFSKASGTGGGYESSNKAQKAFVAEHQESYEWRKALNSDSDFDGLENSVETGAGSNPNVADSDGDFILDGSEPGWNLDTDLDGKKNALDKDSDNDGVADGVEDANHDGYRQAGETDMLVRDTDADGIQDGTEKGITFATDTADTCEQSGDPGCGSAWLFKQDTDTATLTNALDQDSDDDGVCDGTCAGFSEDADADGLKDAGETGATTADSDGDGIQDGTEKGLVTPLKDTDVTKFAPDKDPASVTDPTDADGDNAGGGDGVGDGLEDKNHNGRVDLGETSPILMDTDGDGLCDGLCLGQGEDKNGNGVQDKKADGTLLETDPLSKDSDVDGLLDNAEILGTWCYAGGSCTGNGALDPMNPDSDGDGLRDGQEAAGWRVGVWYERTMEKKTDYQVTSDPRATFTDTDGDTLSDFSEFLNGSDARVQDTDGDGIRDDVEIQLKSNITGIEGSPPQVVNLRLEISISWDWDHWNTVPVKTNITVRFNVSDNVGIDRVQVRLAGVLGNFTHVVQIPEGSRVEDVSETFTYSLAQAFLAGADLNITTYDVNGNGAWGEFHVDSVAETVFKTIVAVFAPIAKVVVEAVSSAFDWIWEAIQGLISAVVEPILDSARNLAIALLAPWATWLAANEFRTDPPPVQTADDPLYPFLAATILLTSALFLGYMALMLVLLAIEIMTKVVLPFLILATTAIANFVSNYLMVIVGITAIIVTFNFINPDNSEPAGGINGFLFSKMSSSEFSAFRWAGRTFLTIVAELFAGAKLISALTSPGVLALVGLTLLIISPLVAKGILKLVLDVFGYCVTMASVAHLATTPAAEAARRASIARAVGDFIAAIGAPISEYLILSRDYNGPSSIVIPPPPP